MLSLSMLTIWSSLASTVETKKNIIANRKKSMCQTKELKVVKEGTESGVAQYRVAQHPDLPIALRFVPPKINPSDRER
jgi:hypothetical protein